MSREGEEGPLEIRAYAKINLSLEVLRRRPDGYHQIVSVMQTIDLHDVVRLEASGDLTFKCDEARLGSPDNLAWRAAEALQTYSGSRLGASIQLIKRIPAAAGLGGGSSDAAAVLKGLNQLWSLDLGAPQLAEMGAKLGLDIPFFLYGGTALVEGRGERITPLRPLSPLPVVLVRPPLVLPGKTAALYGRLRPPDFSSGETTYSLAERIQQGQGLASARLVNVFQRVVLNEFPIVADTLRRMREAGADAIHLSGSGPTLFSLAATDDAAQGLYDRLASEHLEAYLAKTTRA